MKPTVLAGYRRRSFVSCCSASATSFIRAANAPDQSTNHSIDYLRRCLEVFYEASDTLELSSYKNVAAWRERMEARPATAKGLIINSGAEDGAFKEYHSE